MKWIGWFLAVICVGIFFGNNQGGKEELVEAQQRVDAKVEAERDKINRAYTARQKNQVAAEAAIEERDKRIETHSGSKGEAEAVITKETAAIAELKGKIATLDASINEVTQEQSDTATSLKEAEATIPKHEKTIEVLKKHIPSVMERQN